MLCRKNMITWSHAITHDHLQFHLFAPSTNCTSALSPEIDGISVSLMALKLIIRSRSCEDHFRVSHHWKKNLIWIAEVWLYVALVVSHIIINFYYYYHSDCAFKLFREGKAHELNGWDWPGSNKRHDLTNLRVCNPENNTRSLEHEMRPSVPYSWLHRNCLHVVWLGHFFFVFFFNIIPLESTLLPRLSMPTVYELFWECLRKPVLTRVNCLWLACFSLQFARSIASPLPQHHNLIMPVVNRDHNTRCNGKMYPIDWAHGWSLAWSPP